MLDHLLSRGYDYRLYPTQWISGDQLTVPLFDLSNKLKGMQTYTRDAPKKTKNPADARYFTRSFGGQPLWGREVVFPSNIVVLTESVFKSASLHILGINSWTTLNATISKDTKKQLEALPYTFICWGDDDPAGVKFSKRMGLGLVSKDIDELPVDEILNRLNEVLNGNSV